MTGVVLQFAEAFSIDELTRIYNESRKDYMISMPMTVARMQRYIDLYDVDLGHSVVAIRGSAFYGIGMLGVREGVSWITRLGVMPAGRRMGVGRKMVRHLLDHARALGQYGVKLEVIQGNVPAIRMFRSLGFRSGNELLILHRESIPTMLQKPEYHACLTYKECLAVVQQYPMEQPWILQAATFHNARDVTGMKFSCSDGTTGWMVFRRRKRGLSHFVFHTIAGDPERLAAAGLAALVEKYPGMKIRIENISGSDPHLPMLLRAGLKVDFKRTELMKVF